MDWPPLNSLPELVNMAVDNIRLFMYPIPPELVEKIDFDLNATPGRWPGSAQRKKHPWMDLEPVFWKQFPHYMWTSDPERANFFVIPHTVHAHRVARDTLPIAREHLSHGLVQLLHWIYFAQPYFNRTGGQNHVIAWVAETGMKCDCILRSALAREPLAWQMLGTLIRVGYWAHEDFDTFGWRADVDIAVPQWGAAGLSWPPPPTWQTVVASRTKWALGFKGSYWGSAYTCSAVGSLGLDRVHCSCSPGVRTWLQGYMSAMCANKSTSSGLHRSAVAAAANGTGTGMAGRCSNDPDQNAMGSAWYALCPAAWACWSSRLYHAIDRLVIPVIMADGALQPFESIFDWRRFSIKMNVSKLTQWRMGDSNARTALDDLYEEALATAHHCATCPTCEQCASIGLVKRVRRLERVRRWLLYNSSTTESVVGLVALELYCRQLWRTGEGKAPCRRVQQQVSPSTL